MNRLYKTENITIYANSTLIQTLAVINLTSYSKASLTVYWNTSNVTLGNYTLHVQTDVLLGNIEINDNIYTGCNIEVIIFDVDFNDDGVVNALDPCLAAIHFGQNRNQSIRSKL